MDTPQPTMAELLSVSKFDSPPHNASPQWAVRTLVPPSGNSKDDATVLWTSSPKSNSYDMGMAERAAGMTSSPLKEIELRRPPITVQWKNISLTSSGGKPILKGVSGIVCTGELTAIMGPSGAGKSTLLNVLSGFTRQKVAGEILVNGEDRDMRIFRKLSCYIMQDDHLLPHLTVRESIYLAACLKIPSTVSKADRKKAVDECMQSLGLMERQHNKASQLSGGQRKRLCIAQELVSNPPLIFLDEPTSGLDSSSCLQCIQLLKSLADEGRTVICTIHQPSARVFEIFDKLYMLAEGQCIYRGSTKDLIPFLAKQGLACPQYHNPTDFATEVATGEHGDYIKKLKKAVDALGDLDDSFMMEETSLESKIEPGLQASTLCLLQDKVERKTSLFKMASLESSYGGYSTSNWNQFTVLTYRSLICTIREPMATQLRLFAHVIVGLLLGMLYFGIGNDASKIFNNSGFLFFSLLFLIFTAMMPTVLTFPMEKTIFAREHLNSWYNTKMYYLAKTVAEIPFQILFPVIYGSIVYWMTAQPNDLIRFGLFLLSSIMISLVAQSVGLIIGAATSVQNAVFLAPVVSIPILLFSGFFISLDTIPKYLQWLSYISYIRYSYQSVLLGIYSMDRPELHCDKLFCPFQEPQDFLKEMDMVGGNLYVDYAALWGFFAVFRFIAYHVLWYKVVYNR
ncbi:ATP-binding cassette sub-family G member 1-like isoform X2 [Stegodyphus dumicola]|uniref:ATP-binding cassette sub-family G member 1-like isoform X2 n=1 Tax=Stegodyphus dumicola TaxID=202533 RepID=UPI0015AFA73E|nr:ATP-binding cassette sub-family G member 1-like isoform X2 [Stegodyphus dumicola]